MDLEAAIKAVRPRGGLRVKVDYFDEVGFLWVRDEESDSGGFVPYEPDPASRFHAAWKAGSASGAWKAGS